MAIENQIFYKSFGYKYNGQSAIACIGLAIKYNDKTLEVVDSMYSLESYFNIKNPEDGTLVAALDIMNKTFRNKFFSKGSHVVLSGTSLAITCAFAEHSGHNLVNLLSKKQYDNTQKFEKHIVSLLNKYEATAKVPEGFFEKIDIIGLEMLSDIEDILLNKLNAKVNIMEDYKTKRKEYYRAKAQGHYANADYHEADAKRYEEGKYFDPVNKPVVNNLINKMAEVSRRNIAYLDAEEKRNQILNDVSSVPKTQHYI